MTCNNEAPQLNPAFTALLDEGKQREDARQITLRNNAASAFGDFLVKAGETEIEAFIEHLKNPNAVNPTAKVSVKESVDNSAEITDLKSRVKDAESKLSDKEDEIASLNRQLNEANERKDSKPVATTAPVTPAPKKLPPNIVEALRRMQLPSEDRDHIAVNERGTDIEKADFERQVTILTAEKAALQNDLNAAKAKPKETPKAPTKAAPVVDVKKSPEYREIEEENATLKRRVETLENSKKYQEDEELKRTSAEVAKLFKNVDFKPATDLVEKAKAGVKRLAQSADRKEAGKIVHDDWTYVGKFNGKDLKVIAAHVASLDHSVLNETEGTDTGEIEPGPLHK